MSVKSSSNAFKTVYEDDSKQEQGKYVMLQVVHTKKWGGDFLLMEIFVVWWVAYSRPFAVEVSGETTVLLGVFFSN